MKTALIIIDIQNDYFPGALSFSLEAADSNRLIYPGQQDK
jgi:nicotinamidase-related amidase